MSYLVKLENLNKIYKTSQMNYHALHNININLQLGEMVAIMGASGSGKSTLMNILGFLDHCTTGAYFFLNQDVSNLTQSELANIRGKKIGFVFQSFYLLPRLTVLKNIMLPLFYQKIKKTAAQQKAFIMLEKLNMQPFAYYYPNQLSGGQQQRIAIARALVTQPEIILADEPTGALDSTTSQEIMNILLHLNQDERKTIVIVTHDAYIGQLCQRVIKLKDGCIVS